MTINFDLGFTYLMHDEGTKYTNDPRDPGGPTKFGITLVAYQNFLKRLVTAVEIQALTLDQARDFYYRVYWEPVCDKIQNAAIAVCIFDCAVLYGLGTASLMAQKAASRLSPAAIKLDGIIGDKTVEVLDLVKEEDFLDTYHALVLEKIDKVISAEPTLEVYRKGWTARADRLLTLTDLAPLIEETTKQQERS